MTVQEADNVNEDVPANRTTASCKSDCYNNSDRRSLHPREAASLIEPRGWDTQMRNTHSCTPTTASLAPLPQDEKAAYRHQLHTNQTMIAERFYYAQAATSGDVEHGTTAAQRDEPAAPASSSKTKRRLLSDNDDESRPGVQFVRHQGLGFNLDSILVRLTRANTRRPSAVATDLAVDVPSTTSPTDEVDPYHQYSSYKHSYRVAIVAVFFGVAAIIAVVLGVLLLGNNRSSHTQGPKTDSAKVTAFDSLSRNCDSVIAQGNPHVVTQCNCHKKIFKLASDIKARYEVLAKTFVPTINVEIMGSMESCSPENQALVWLASGDGLMTEPSMQQRYSLALLFIVWNGANWKQANAWLSSANECTWHGVTCRNYDRIVTDIELGSNNLVGPLTGKVSLLANLTSLALENNNFRGSAIPSEIGLLTGLKNLLLTSTGVYGTIPADLFKLGNVLENFEGNNNNLSGTIPTLIGELAQLGHWILGNNNLGGTIPSEIGRCTSLSYFQLDGNAMLGTIPIQVGSMTFLEILSLNNNRLTGTIPKELGSCHALQVLSLRNNNLNGTVPNELGSAKYLENLDLSGNQITGTTPASICRLANAEDRICRDCNCPQNAT